MLLVEESACRETESENYETNHAVDSFSIWTGDYCRLDFDSETRNDFRTAEPWILASGVQLTFVVTVYHELD